ncbi:hypothetical protein NUU61_008805 [Penicillium alfredii]|uniref:Thiamine pyrophosphate enzyme TPP-binding domain-containing protein n=1 Tax=Penicillium alfredii TaxID=1506179 RepID=A0A9W9JWR7_9EURO|nr:uncharacterized protein NUU61_008805 [Penicillium alfredii]KAJ5084226.1 hypothetical protein NUU61_008805 [Penicillium alfredii]
MPIDVGIVTDVGEALLALNRAVADTPFTAPLNWKETVLGKRREPNSHEEQDTHAEGRMHPYHAMKARFTSLEPGSIISIDGGETGSWANDLTESANPHLTFFSAGYIGMLSNGWGYSLGAAIADLTRLVINIQGDGSAGFQIGELDTSKASYRAVADAFGMPAAKVSEIDFINPTVRSFLAMQGPVMLELIVSDKITHPGTAAMIGNTSDPNTIVVPYYDNVPRPYYK